MSVLICDIRARAQRSGARTCNRKALRPYVFCRIDYDYAHEHEFYKVEYYYKMLKPLD